MIFLVVAAVFAAPPNVVLVSVDTLRADHLGCYGYPHATSPNIDKLAETGLLFEDCVCQVPLTNPSFSAVMTSRYPRTTGATRNGIPTPQNVPTVAQRFREAGYQTLCVQSNWPLKAHLSGLDQGFDVYDDDFHTRRWGILKTERRADEVTRLAKDLLARRDPAKPFFMWVHYSDPHAPYLFHKDRNVSGDAYAGQGKIGLTRRDYD